MQKFIKTAAAASLLLSGAATAMAQAQNPNADQRPLPPDQMNQQPYAKDQVPTNPPAGPAQAPGEGAGSRALTPGGNPSEHKTEPADKGTTNLKKLDDQGRGGQGN